MITRDVTAAHQPQDCCYTGTRTVGCTIIHSRPHNSEGFQVLSGTQASSKDSLFQRLVLASPTLVSVLGAACVLALLVGPTAINSLLDSSSSTGELLGILAKILVYGYVLLQGAGLLSDGSELLLEILNPGVVGGVVLPVLGAMPDALIILSSGLGATSCEEAQQQLAVGIGTLAGSSILLLSLGWGLSVLLGRCDLDPEGNMINKRLTRGGDLLTTGVSTDSEVPKGALVMAVTVLLYGTVQVPAFLGDVEDPLAALLGATACLTAMVGYCVYQVVNPELQKRKILEARRKWFRSYAVRAMTLQAEKTRFGSLMTSSGEVSRAGVDQVFDLFDHDRSGSIDSAELQALLVALQLSSTPHVTGDGLKEVEELWWKEFDLNSDRGITKDEFYIVMSRWIGEKLQESPGAPSPSTQLRRLADPSVARATLLELPAVDVELLAATAAELAQEDDEEEARADMGEGLEGNTQESRDIAVQALLKMSGGLVLCALFSDPLVESLSDLSQVTGVAPFFVGFVLTPLASNASEFVSSLRFASAKKSKNISLTFSQVYGAVTMNNTLVLGLFLLVVYWQKLDWVYSSEVTVVVVATLLMGLLGFRNQRFAAWWALPALAIYPVSLGAVWALDKYLGWQ